MHQRISCVSVNRRWKKSQCPSHTEDSIITVTKTLFKIQYKKIMLFEFSSFSNRLLDMYKKRDKNSTLTGNVNISSFSDNTGHWERQERDYSHSVRFRFQSQPLSSGSTCTKHILCHKIPRLLSSFEASQTRRCVFALKKEFVSKPKSKW